MYLDTRLLPKACELKSVANLLLTLVSKFCAIKILGALFFPLESVVSMGMTGRNTMN